MQKRIVVLGGVGFIGSHLCLRLLNDGHEVFCVDIRDTADSPLLRDMPPHPEFRYVRHNIVNAFGIRCDEIYNLAAPSRVRYNKALPVESLKVSILGSINALDTARSEHARILYASTGDIYGTGYRDTSVEAADGCPTHRTLAEGKRAGEALHRAYQYEFGVDARIARIFNTYGPRQSARAIIPTIIGQIASGKRDIIVGDLSPTRDFNFVGDTVRGFLALAQAEGIEGRDINIASGTEISMRQTLDTIATLMNTEVTFVTDPARLRPANSEVFRLCGDNSLITTLTDWHPRWSLEDGLRATIDWFVRPENLAKYKTDIYNR